MSNYDVNNSQSFAIKELTSEQQQHIQGGSKVNLIKYAGKAIAGVTAAAGAAAKSLIELFD